MHECKCKSTTKSKGKLKDFNKHQMLKEEKLKQQEKKRKLLDVNENDKP